MHEKGEKTHNLGTSRRLLPVQLKFYRYKFVTGHFWPSSTGRTKGSTGTTATLFPVSTSFGILAITCSFLIRFE